MKHFVAALFACIAISYPAFAAETKDSCKFDPKNIVLDDVVKLYSCVPIADTLCAQTCGTKSASTAINTKIDNGQIGKTTILCQAPNAKDKTLHQVKLAGQLQPLDVQCGDTSTPAATAPTAK